MAQTIEDVKLALDKMKPNFQSGFTYEEQQYLESLNYLLFKKQISNKGCQDCYRDAFIIISNKLKTMSELPKRSSYILKAGIVEHPFGTSEYYVLDMPDEAAETLLHQYPEKISEFQAYPEDWEARITARFAPQQPKASTSEQSTIPAKKTARRANS